MILLPLLTDTFDMPRHYHVIVVKLHSNVIDTIIFNVMVQFEIMLNMKLLKVQVT